MRDVVDQLKVSFWYETIRHQTKFESTYQIEKYYEEKFGSNNSSNYFRNKWRKYKLGLHTPRKELIEQIGNEIPESATIINHPLWHLLKNPDSVKENSHNIVAQLPLKVSTIFFKSLLVQKDGFYYLVYLNDTLFTQDSNKILECSPLDSLCAFVIYSHLDKFRPRDALRLLYMALLMFGVECHNNGMVHIAIGLFEILKEKIFTNGVWLDEEYKSSLKSIIPDAELTHLSFNTKANYYLLQIEYLNHCTLVLFPKARNKMKAMRQILMGEMNEEYLVEFSPNFECTFV